MQTANGYQQDNRSKYLAIFLVTLFVVLMLFGCRTVAKTSSSEKRESVTIVDSIRVKKYDTSVTTHEITEYQTKTVEVFDTVRTVKDSVIVILKTRTIWVNSKQEKTETKAGTGSDSAILKLQKTEKIETSRKTVDKKIKWGNMVFPLLTVIIGCIIIWYGLTWLGKKYNP